MIEPTDADIILGRGIKINNHPGNEAYREIIHQNAVRKEREMKFYSSILSIMHTSCAQHVIIICVDNY